jgi:DNA-binding transcriptional MerR regulator
MGTRANTNQSYSIMEAATLSGLPESTLRYYETIGIIDPIDRDSSSKHRVYSEDDINVIVSIACLNATGMSIGDMRSYLKNRGRGAQAADEQIKLLQTQEQRLGEEARYLQLHQRYVETKIAYWRAVAAGDGAAAATTSTRARTITKELKLPIEK